MRLTILLILLPCLINGHGQGWKINQPHRYVIINGEYIELPFEDRDTESPSVLNSSNPMNVFQNFWSSLTSLSFLKNQEATNESEDSATDVEQTEESAPTGTSVPFSSYFSDPVSSLTGFGSLFTGTGGFMKKNSYAGNQPPPASHVHKRSLDLSTKRKDEVMPTGPVRYMYRPLGQGSFVRYEIPILTPEELAAEKRQKEKANSVPFPEYPEWGHHKEFLPPYNPFSHMNPKHKPQYTKPYYHEEDTTMTYSNGNKGKTKDSESSTEDTKTETEDPFPCPKVGLWKYDGKMCTAIQAIPPWSCKPIDLVKSGKLVICRNKVYY